MILSEITEYKLKLRLYINSVCVFGSFFFVLLLFFDGRFILGYMSLASGLYFATVVYFLERKKQYLWKGRGFLFILPPTFLTAIYLNPDIGIFWAYVGIVSLFLVLEFKDAYISSTLFALLVFYLITPYFGEGILYRIYTTLTLVWLFSFSFSYLIEHLLGSLNALATHDTLTKALNRHTFHNSIDIALEENQRYRITGILFFFDLDHFKRINDEHGHLAGDQILQEIAEIVRARLRKTDQFFRYGGEEFAILLRHSVLQNAAHVAEELRTQIQNHKFRNGISVTISGGLSEVQKTDDVNAWITRSDAALYEAKSDGRNCIRINVPTLEGMRAQSR